MMVWVMALLIVAIAVLVVSFAGAWFRAATERDQERQARSDLQRKESVRDRIYEGYAKLLTACEKQGVRFENQEFFLIPSRTVISKRRLVSGGTVNLVLSEENLSISLQVLLPKSNLPDELQPQRLEADIEEKLVAAISGRRYVIFEGATRFSSDNVAKDISGAVKVYEKDFVEVRPLILAYNQELLAHLAKTKEAEELYRAGIKEAEDLHEIKMKEADELLRKKRDEITAKLNKTIAAAK